MEMEDFGFPPVFHETEDVDEAKVTNVDGEPVIKDKAKGKKVNQLYFFPQVTFGHHLCNQ